MLLMGLDVVVMRMMKSGCKPFRACCAAVPRPVMPEEVAAAPPVVVVISEPTPPAVLPPVATATVETAVDRPEEEVVDRREEDSARESKRKGRKRGAPRACGRFGRRARAGCSGLAWVGLASRDPVSSGAQLVASVFVLVCGHYSALGVKFFNRL